MNDWFDNTFYTRLNDKKTGRIIIIIIMQRLHEDDLVGHVLGLGERWTVIRFPALTRVLACLSNASPPRFLTLSCMLLTLNQLARAMVDARNKAKADCAFGPFPAPCRSKARRTAP